MGRSAEQCSKSLKQPMLILQGKRDYQVTMEDFDGWKLTADPTKPPLPWPLG